MMFWCNFQVRKCTKIQIFLGLHPRTRWESLRCSPRLLSWWGGPRCPLPTLGPLGLALSIPTFYSRALPMS